MIDDALCACGHRVIWHHDTRGCGYHGHAAGQRCECRLSSGEVCADREAKARAEVTAAVEALADRADRREDASRRLVTTLALRAALATPTAYPDGTATREYVEARLDVAAIQAAALRDAANAVQEVFDLQCPPRARSDYMDRGAWVAHSWWNTALGSTLQRLRDRADRLAEADPPT